MENRGQGRSGQRFRALFFTVKSIFDRHMTGTYKEEDK